VFERYSKSAVRVLRLWLEEGRERGSASIRTEHLLLAVLRVNDHIAKTILERAYLLRRWNRKGPNHNHPRVGSTTLSIGCRVQVSDEPFAFCRSGSVTVQPLGYSTP